MKRFFVDIITLVLGLVFILSNAHSVNAQDTGDYEFTLEEITVTAEKKEQNLQKTSMSIAVVQGTELMDKGSEDLHAILKDVPSLVTTESSMGAKIAIRGVGQNMPIGVGESPVSTNFDGVYQMRWEAGVFGYFDIDRVEVLRGPQGMLYGRNATAGVVNVISSKPKVGVTEGNVAIEVGDYNKMKAEAAINIPISDTFAGRLAFVTTKQDATTTDLYGGRDSQQGVATRLQIRYQPSDEVYVNLLTNYVQRNGSLMGPIYRSEWAKGNYDINNNTYPYSRVGRQKYNSLKFTLTAEFPIGPGVVTFLPSYENVAARSATYSLNPSTGLGQFSFGGQPYDNETKAAELRYASKSDTKVQWVGGLYWTDTQEPGSPRDPPPAFIKYYKSYAVFGQITYPFSDTFRGIIGGRSSEDKKGYENNLLAPPKASFKFKYNDWKLGFEKDHSENLMSYFTLATGHRPGGYAEETGIVFKTESLISGEYGLKSRFLDQRFQVNWDVYYYDYRDYQVTDGYQHYNEETGLTETVSMFFNVDKVTNYGAEIEASALVGDATMLNFSITYLHARYKSDYRPHLTRDEVSAQSQKGMPLPQSPDFTVNASIDHTFLFSSGASLKPRVSARWRDDAYIAPVISPTRLQEAFTIVDATLTYSSKQKWSLNFYCNNVMDKMYMSGIGLGVQEVVFPSNPRMVGVTFNITF